MVCTQLLNVHLTMASSDLKSQGNIKEAEQRSQLMFLWMWGANKGKRWVVWCNQVLQILSRGILRSHVGSHDILWFKAYSHAEPLVMMWGQSETKSGPLRIDRWKGIIHEMDCAIQSSGEQTLKGWTILLVLQVKWRDYQRSGATCMSKVKGGARRHWGAWRADVSRNGRKLGGF